MKKTVEQAAEEINNVLAPLPLRDALQALHIAQGKILTRHETVQPGSFRRILAAVPEHCLFKIDRDPEVKALILSFDQPTSGPEILQALRSKFSPERVPSKTALYRWLQRQAGISPVSRKGHAAR